MNIFGNTNKQWIFGGTEYMQTIENRWLDLKTFVRKGTYRSPHQWEYIREYILRKKYQQTFLRN